MAISFDEVPSAVRAPFVYVEFNSDRAVQGSGVQEYKILVLGQKTAGGTQDALDPAQVTSATQAATLFGAGSMLHNMAEKLFANNTTTEKVFVAFDDPAGANATGELNVSGVPTSAGTVFLYIAGRRIQIAVATTDTASDIATNIISAVTANTSLPVTAGVGGTSEDVEFTAKNAGEAGNDIDIRLNYFVGENTPTGLTLTITPMAGGTASPDFSTLWPVLGDTHYNIIANPYTDAASLVALDNELDDRWGPIRQIEGVAISALNADFGDSVTKGNSLNSQFLSLMNTYKVPNTPYEVAAAIAGKVAFHGANDPARPFQTLELDEILPAYESDRFTREERNLLLFDGIATNYVDNGGNVRIERLITTYQTNGVGAPDTAFLDLNTVLTLGYLRFDFRTFFQLKFPRHKLADDGTRFGAGQAVMTPNLARAESIARFRNWETLGLVENIDQFKEDLIVERNQADPNRLDILLPPDLVNQLRVTGVQIGFLL